METVKSKNMIYSVQSGQSWFGVTHNVNIYRGCDHGCIYCDSRSSCYRIDEFDRIRVKEDADTKIDHELSRKRKTGIIGLGGMNDPYNRFEVLEEYTSDHSWPSTSIGLVFMSSQKAALSRVTSICSKRS